MTPERPSPPEPDARIARLLAGLWQRNQSQVLERLALLDEAAAALAAGVLSHPLRERAISTAHKLAGTLGMFGHPRGTEVARQLEAAYEASTPSPAIIYALTAQLRQTLYPA